MPQSLLGGCCGHTWRPEINILCNTRHPLGFYSLMKSPNELHQVRAGGRRKLFGRILWNSSRPFGVLCRSTICILYLLVCFAIQVFPAILLAKVACLAVDDPGLWEVWCPIRIWCTMIRNHDQEPLWFDGLAAASLKSTQYYFYY